MIKYVQGVRGHTDVTGKVVTGVILCYLPAMDVFTDFPANVRLVRVSHCSENESEAQRKEPLLPVTHRTETQTQVCGDSEIQPCKPFKDPPATSR